MRTGSKLGHVYVTVLLDERCCAVSYRDAHRQRCETVTVKPRAVVYRETVLRAPPPCSRQTLGGGDAASASASASAYGNEIKKLG